MEQTSKIVVLGLGLIGSQILQELRNKGYQNAVGCGHQELDLTNQRDVFQYFEKEQPDYAFFCAVKAITDFECNIVGDAEECYANIMMQCNVLEAAKRSQVKKMILLNSAMLYPWNLEDTDSELKEEDLDRFNWPGYRATMKPSVLTKFVSLKMGEYYSRQYGMMVISCLPTHIYGGFHGRKNLYFLERLVMDISDAHFSGQSEVHVDVFGKGIAKKQFLHVQDCASGIISVMERYEDITSPVNIAGEETVCWSLIVEEICAITGYQGRVLFNTQHEENVSSRLCSIEKLKQIGWRQNIFMKQGIRMLCKEYAEKKGR